MTAEGQMTTIMEGMRKKILAIDDNKDNIIVLKAIINDSFPDAEFLFADSGKAGLTLCRTMTPDLILLDIIMPDMDGYEVCRAVKEDENLRVIPVVMLTANRANREGHIEALEAGADAFLSKPVDESELIAQIKAMLRLKEFEDQKTERKWQLEKLVADRTKALEAELLIRKKAEKKLRENEQKYRLLIENQGEGVGVVDLDEKFLFANPAAEEMFGVPAGALVGRNLFDFVAPESRKIILNETKSRSQGIKSSYEIYIVRPEGEKRTILVTATPQFNNEGAQIGTFGVFRDITQRKIAETELQMRQRFIETIIENAPIGFSVNKIDDGKIIYLGSKFEQIYGVERGSLTSAEQFFDQVYLDPQYREEMKQRISDDIASQDISRMKWENIRILTKDNKERFVTALNIPLYDQNLMISTVQDVTEHKVAEQELIKARNKAEENDKLKTAFLHNISHEIRTPMNAITGFASLLAEPDLTEESRRSYIEIILSSSNHLLSVVSDIIEISNIEAGILKDNQEIVNLNSKMNSLRRQFSIKTAKKGLELICDLPFSDEEATIETDITKLLVILTSLLNNAVKFTRSGRIEFGYYLAGSKLLFRVSDTGIGIPVEHQLRVFDRFYQVEQTVSRSYEGTGLGLSISQAYTEFLGGKIWIESEPWKGSVFCFTIPYKPIKRALISGCYEVKE